MPSPTASLTDRTPDLGTFEEFDLEMQRRGYIASRVMPIIEVNSQAGRFGKIPLKELLQAGSTLRAPGSGYSRGDWNFETATYATEENGWEEPIDDREAKLYANYFDAEQIAAARAYEKVLMGQEQRVASTLFNATTFTSQKTTVTTEWSTAATATPIADVETAVKAVAGRTGIWPNALIIDRLVFRNLRNCAEIIDRIAASGAGSPTKATDITQQMLAQVFDLDFVLVGGNYKNTANKGQDASLSQVWDDEYAMVTKVATSNDMKEPCIGRIFHWGEDGSSPGGQIESYRDETVRGNVIRVRHDVTEVVLYTELAQLLDNITA